MRVSREQLRHQFEMMRSAAVEAGIGEATRWHIELGNKTYGIAYRVWLAHPDYEAGLTAVTETGSAPDDWHTGHYSPVISDFLGMTVSEAYQTLTALREAFSAVTYIAKYGEREL